MGQYLVRRTLGLVVVIWLVTLAVFVLVRVVPGDIAVLKLGQNASPEQVEALRQELGLKEPLYQQYLSWMGNMFRGDLGTSLWTERPVLDELADRLPVTIELALYSILLSVLVGVPTGVISALRQDTWLDQVSRLVAIIGLAMPSFWVATTVLTVLALYFRWSPPSYRSFGEDPVTHLQTMIIPSIVLGFASAALVMRLTRSSMLEVLRQDYVRTARSKGLRELTVIARHALKNALIPVVTVVGLQFGFLLGGTVILEQIFALPGLGRLTLDAIFQRDYPQLQANVLFIAGIFALLNLLVDVAYAYLDPRIRYS